MHINVNSSILAPPRPVSETAAIAGSVKESTEVAEPRHRCHGKGRGNCHSLGVFRQELRYSLKMQFHAKFASTQPSYAQHTDPVSSDDVAAEALGTAKQIVAAQPSQSSKALISMKASVREAASVAQQTVAASDDATELDAAVAKIDDGLERMAEDAAEVRESRASVLDVNMRTKQRSSIRIRTQEGDIVRFDLKQVSRMSASDVAVSNEDGVASSTAVEMSSRSRMSVKVKGDLNESERLAIQAVFDQAQQMADDFFGGDIAAAFEAAQGFEYDAEQLARVNLRFRMRQSSNIAYTETVSTQSRPAIASAAQASQAEPPALTATKPDPAPATDTPVATAVTDTTQPVASNEESVAPPEVPGVAEPPTLDDSALSGFFDLVSDFLRSIGDGFEYASGDAAFRLHYSESFKLELLRTVINTAAPAGAENAAATADAIIGTVAEPSSDAGDNRA